MNVFKDIGKIGKKAVPDFNHIKNEIKSEVLDELRHDIEREITNKIPNIPDEVKKNLPNIPNEVKDFVEDNVEFVVEVIKKHALQNLLKEVEDFAKNKTFSIVKVVTHEVGEINKKNPSSGFSLSASIANNGLTLSWEGSKQLGRILQAVNNSVADGKITTDEMKQVLIQITPSEVSFNVGATIDLAFILGTSIDVGAATTYTKENVATIIENFDETVEQLFVTLPKKVVGEALKV